MRRRRLAALAAGVAAAGGAGAIILLASPGAPPIPADAPHDAKTRSAGRSLLHDGSSVVSRSLPSRVAVGLRVLTIVDRRRTIRYLDGSVRPRTLVTEVRYPAAGPAGAKDLRNAAPLRADGPYPLVVFGHGFGEPPDVYAALLDAWVRAGYVVAAPTFPLTGPSAPGGLSEPDLVNQPADVSVVITRVLAESQRYGASLHGLVARGRVAVSGQSDGGDTALAVAEDPRFRDRRVGAAVILSGAEIPYLQAIEFARAGPPLLATQGTADTINLPSATNAFFDLAPRPKFLLTLIAAPHLPPYTTQQPYLGVVEEVTVEFLDHYLRGDGAALRRMRASGNRSGVAALSGF